MIIIKFVNFVFFLIGWIIACYFHDDFAGIICLVLTVLNLWTYESGFLARLMAAIMVALIGIFNDYFLFQFGIINFPAPHLMIMPFWLISLWFLFCSTLHTTWSFLAKLKLWTLSLVGGCGGAISYLMGSEFAAMSYNFTLLPPIVFHFLDWCIIFPVMYKIQLRYSQQN